MQRSGLVRVWILFCPTHAFWQFIQGLSNNFFSQNKYFVWLNYTKEETGLEFIYLKMNPDLNLDSFLHTDTAKYITFKFGSSLKSVQVMVCLHIFPIFSFLAKTLSFPSSNNNIFARNENIGKICKRTITWTDFSVMSILANFVPQVRNSMTQLTLLLIL